MKPRNIQGAGKLAFGTISPAGLGRLVQIPFYLEDTVTGFQVMTNTGLSANSKESPAILLSAPIANGRTNTVILRTPEIPFALLRFVGFVGLINTPAIPNTPVMDISVSDLKIGGSTNLFVHPEFASLHQYEVGRPPPGFRDLPLIKSPNRMEVSVQGMGITTSASIGFSCAILCDVLNDDEYGQHISGAYARRS